MARAGNHFLFAETGTIDRISYTIRIFSTEQRQQP